MCEDEAPSILDTFPGDDAWEGIYAEGGNQSGAPRTCEGCGYVIMQVQWSVEPTRKYARPV